MNDIEDLVEEARNGLAKGRNNIMHGIEYHIWRKYEIELIRKELLKWYDEHHRILPWRIHSVKEKERMEKIGESLRGYQVWVSEIMLQQTQVIKVINYYEKWMKKWPTIFDLAKAKIEDVYEAWAGLGYYSRAKRLHEAAQYVVEKYDGILPKNAVVLEKEIIGIGKYTAGAISSIAFQQRAALVDGNVIRVLSRLRAIAGDTKSSQVNELLWRLADELVDTERPGDYNQALMELGAIVCTPNKPSCSLCPINNMCRAYAEKKLGDELRKEKNIFKKDKLPIVHSSEPSLECIYCVLNDETKDEEDFEVTRYPHKTKKKSVATQVFAVCILELQKMDASQFFVLQRPDKGLLAKMWEFPSILLEESEISYDERQKYINEFLADKLFFDVTKCNIIKRKYIGETTHVFSHLKHQYFLEHLVITDDTMIDKNITSLNTAWRWLTREDLEKAAMSTGLKNAFSLLEPEAHTLKALSIKRTRKDKLDTKPGSDQGSLLNFYKKQSK